MLAAATVTTFWSGLYLSDQSLPTREFLLQALTFPAALFSILMAHELGHFLACRRHGLDATLPMFLPAPPFPIGLGTFGAFIRIRSPIRTRRQLLDIGAAGPLAGVALALPLIAVGLQLSHVAPLPAPDPNSMNIQFADSLLFTALRWLIKGPLPAGQDVYLHPIALAGWFGLFVTALNLIPAGQFDGGHVAHAMLGRAHRYLSRAVFVTLISFGVFGDLPWRSWLQLPSAVALGVCAVTLSLRRTRRKLDRNVFVVLVLTQLAVEYYVNADIPANGLWLVWGLLAYLIGLDHPPVKERGQPLNPLRRVVGLLCLAVFVGTFMPLPFRFI